MTNFPKQPAKALILGDDYRMVLPIVRSLGHKGVEVHIAWCPAESPAIQSRYVARVHDLPWYSSVNLEWIGALDALIEHEQFNLVIPATEHAVYALQTERARLRNCDRVYLLDDTAYQVVVDKQATYDLCQELQIPYPKTIQIDDRESIDDIARELGMPVIVKPQCSVSAEASLGKQYVRRCHTVDDATAYVAYLQRCGNPTALQQHFDGQGVGIELLAYKGQVLTALQHRRLHETTGHGSTYRETVTMDDRMYDVCEKLMRRLNYTGVAMVEFRVDPHSGDWVLIEINGRFWGSLPLAAAAGIDFPGNLYDMLAEGRTEFSTAYRRGVRARALTNDLRWLWRRFTGRGRRFDQSHTNSLGWVANDVAWQKVLVHTLRGLLLQDHIDSFARDDIRPAIAELFALARDAAVSLQQRLRNVLPAALHPRRWARPQHV